MITALGGGSGAAKFLEGLSRTVSKNLLSVIVNTADDMDIYGMRVSPDIDTIIYRLSGNIDKKKGWGLSGDTFNFLSAASSLGFPSWFGMGDKDLATHMFRKKLSDSGATLSESTKEIAKRFSLEEIRILPMSDDRVESWINTDRGEMHFQEYYIKHSMAPKVRGVNIRGIEKALPAPFVLESIKEAEIVIICPSNPIISIGPILGVQGIRKTLVDSSGIKVAISPLIGGKALKGPADRLMRGLGMEVTSTQVARLYADFLDVMVIDRSDAKEAQSIEALGVKAVVTDILIPNTGNAIKLANRVLELGNFPRLT